MNDKLALQDLVEILSKKAKINKKEADLFFRELFQLILDRIFENDSVKIKDFGTFKLTSVSSRESVNVNTGEKIEIPAHSRLSFSPDKTLKNLVNKPFSQFETILLEEGTVIDSIDLDMDEEEDFSSDQDEAQNPTLKQDIEETKTVDLLEAELVADSEVKEEPREVLVAVKPIEPEKEKISDSNQIETPSQPWINNPYSSRSFVYTYTTSTSDNTGVITLTFPKEDLIIVSDDQIDQVNNPNEKEEIVDDYTQELPQEIEQTDIEDDIQPVSVIENMETAVSDDSTLNDKHPDVIQEEDELELELDAEIETEEDVIMPPVIDHTTIVDEAKKHSSDSITAGVITLSKGIDDPERPLVPLDEDFIDEIESDGDTLLEQQDGSAINNMPVDSSISFENIDHIHKNNMEAPDFVEAVDNLPYYDYSKPTLGVRIMKKLPIIIFISIVVCFTIYGFAKLFDVKYDYEYYLGNKDLTLADTLPFVDERVESVTKLSDTLTNSLDTTENTKINLEAPSLSLDEKTKTSSDTSNSAPIPPNSESGSKQDDVNMGRVISDRLRINVINKGLFHIKNRPKVESKKDSLPATIAPTTLQSKEVVVEKKPTSKAVYVTMKRGATLRTMSTKYYRNPNYWVYIYQANRTKLSNPDDISVGMKLLVPDLSNYGVSDISDPREIQKAKRLEAQLLRQ